MNVLYRIKQIVALLSVALLTLPAKADEGM